MRYSLFDSQLENAGKQKGYQAQMSGYAAMADKVAATVKGKELCDHLGFVFGFGDGGGDDGLAGLVTLHGNQRGERVNSKLPVCPVLPNRATKR
jgi:hypothetical protein